MTFKTYDSAWQCTVMLYLYQHAKYQSSHTRKALVIDTILCKVVSSILYDVQALKILSSVDTTYEIKQDIAILKLK